MKKPLLFLFVLLSVTTLSAQIGFQEHEVTSFSTTNFETRMVDIDNDGHQDIVTFGNSFDWYENKFPEDGFKAIQNIAVLSGYNFIHSIEFTDFDGDGDLDILGAEFAGDKLFLIPNLGQATFGPLQVLKSINQVQIAKHIDMDADGDKDLFYSAYGGDTAQSTGYYENTGGSNNYSILHIITNEFINVDHDIKVVDLDNDGLPDIFFRFIGGITWIKNNGATFSAMTEIDSYNTLYRDFDVVDIDNDGDVDYVGHVVWNGNAKLVYKLNDGLGNFAPEQVIRQIVDEQAVLKLDDLDNDSKIDIIFSPRYVSNEYQGDIVWYKNNGSLNFTDKPALDINVRQVFQIGTFDLNNDGLKDVIVGSHLHRIATYQNNGSGTFRAAKYPAASVIEASCAVPADIDGDGDMDIVSSSLDEGKIYWYRLNADGTYANQVVITHLVTEVKEVVAADMDGDGDLDVVAVSGASDTGYIDRVSWYRNLDGLGNFGPQINIPIGIYDSPDGLIVYDVDGDGDKDIITSLDNWPENADRIIWYANDGSGSFAAEQVIATGPYGVKKLRLADINNDGKPDLVSASALDDTVCWFENLNGLGSFGPQHTLTTTAQYVRDVSVADLDSDGDNDVVYVSNYPDNDVIWQSNLDGLGTFGPARVINSNVDLNGAAALFAGDIDSDADIDIIVGGSNRVTWSENLYGQGNFEPAKVISATTSSSQSVQMADADNDGDNDVLVASAGIHKIVWFKNQGQTLNTIKGVVRLDLEGNGCGANDTHLPNMLVSTTDGTNTLATVTFGNTYGGQYRLYTGEGDFVTSVITDAPTYFVMTPASHNASFTGFGNIATADFCIEPIGQINDLNVRLYPLDDARPGFDVSYQLVYQNIGTTTLTGQATLQFDHTKIQFLNATTVPSSQTANTLNYSFTNLAPFERRTVVLNFRLFAPPTTNINDNLVFTAAIAPSDADYTPLDNTHLLTQNVIGSFDPNDITCVEGNQVLIANADKYLHYAIRFQNTGTASAINVKVQHEFDAQLDWTTFQLEGMSHNGRTTITNESVVEFMFNNINLPHSAANEPLSHGYITFKIKPKANTIDVGDIVHATADIYFDFNPPVITNTAATEYVEVLGTESFEVNPFTIHPNPAKDRLTITGAIAIEQVEIYTVLGTKVLVEKNKSVIDVADLESGVYLISIQTKKGKAIKKFIKQ